MPYLASPFNSKDRLEYIIRSSWYHTKLALKIDPKSDKNFLCHDFAVRLRRGDFPADTCFTIAGRRDGVGMQGMARLSGLLFAHVFGATYIDTPFSYVDHISNQSNSSLETWESLFNFGLNERLITHNNVRIIDYKDFLNGKSEIGDDCAFRFPQCFWLYRRHPELLDRATHLFQSKYDWPKKSHNSPLSIAVHIRRGDVSLSKNPMRFTHNSIILNTISRIEQTLQKANRDYRITIHSQGAPQDFIEFANRGYSLNLEQDAIVAMRQFIESDILFMSKSSFSYLAAIYNKGIKLYLPTFNPPLPSWIRMDDKGRFNQEELHAKIVCYMAKG